jgi:hypothetical protein
MRAHIQAVTVLLFAVAAANAVACSCYPVDMLLENDAAGLRRMRENSDHIVHARVVKVLDPGEAEIEILESFKSSSAPRTIKARIGDGAACGRGPFSKGEEGIFFVYDGSVNLCRKYNADDPSLKKALRRLGE